MASGRFLSHTIATDPQLARLSMAAELLFLKCIPHLDRDGICTTDPLALLGIISPMRFSELQANMPAIIDEWVTVGLVIRYETRDGSAIWFKGFAKQQSLRYHRERPSQYPPPPGMLRSDTGIVNATAIPWTETPEHNAATPANQAILPDIIPNIPDSPPQQQQQHKQQQQQQKPAPDPAAAAAAQEMLQEFGIVEAPQLAELSRHPPEHIAGWIAYTRTQPKLNNPIGYLIRQLRTGKPPPPAATNDDDDDTYQALKRRYIPAGLEDIIEH